MSKEQFLNGKVTLHCGDCLAVLATLAENSMDACVTDPPYHLTSIVKRFGGDNAAPAKGNDAYIRASQGFMGKQWDGGDIAFRVELWAAVLRVLKPGGHLVAFSGTRTYHRMVCAIEDAGFEVRDQIGWMFGSGFPKSHNLVAPWQGWGTALKPAWEPIVLARKPLSQDTIAANVLKWGTGAINVDGCRIEAECRSFGNGTGRHGGQLAGGGNSSHERGAWESNKGRWPANLIHDGSEEVVAAFPDVHGAEFEKEANETPGGGMFKMKGNNQRFGDSGSAARFFYSAKADSDDRIGSKHPTVKPVDLMRYLCRLVTPPGGIVLDPFAGTGTTGEAAFREDMRAILIEREEEYLRDIRRRMALVLAGPDERAFATAKEKQRGKPPDHGPLFREEL